MAVITISRESGAQGSLVARKLAERLGYRLVDREVIHEVCMEYGIRQDEFESIYEHAPGLLERYDRRNREIVQLIGRVVQGLARRDNTIIVGRGAFAILRSYGDVLNVRVTGKRSQRVQRIQQSEGLSKKEAKTKIDRIDNERSKYVGAFYGLNWSDAALYDICVNTDKLGPDCVVDLVVEAMGRLEQGRSPNLPLVRHEEADPILDQAIGEALGLLEAAAAAKGS